MTMEQKMHELLCAYALGEVDAAQRIEVERALAASAELRKELETIEETIGLVRESVGGGEMLSKEAEKALMLAVNPEPRRNPWYSSGWMRMAAGFLVVGGGAIFMQRMYEANTEGRSPGSVARFEKKEGRKTEASTSEVEADQSTLLAQLDEKDKREQAGMKALTDAGAPAAGEAPMDMVVLAKPKLAEKNAPAEKPASETLNYQFTNKVGQGSADGIQSPPAVLDRNAIGPERDSVDFAGHGVAPSAQDYDLGALHESAPVGSPAPVAGRPAASGTYRGPGDSAPAGRGGGAAGLTSGGAPAEKSREEFGVTYGGRKSGLDDVKAQTEGKAKREELARKVAKPEPNPRFNASEIGEAGSAGSISLGQQAAPSPADEAQVRLRQLLERSDRAEAERLAWLKGDAQSQDAGRKLKGLGYIGGEARDNEASLRELYYKLTPEQRAQLLDQECRRVFDGCRRRPNERPRDMFFRYWGDNPFEITALDALSTFSADVDTASYTLARRYLVEGRLPEKAQIRTEEFVNYFKADVAAPTKGVFAIHTDLAPSRFAQPANSTWTLRVVVRGKELAKEERKPLHLTCVIDCSGSMREQNRIETVKDTLRLLIGQLNSADMVGIVAFSSEARQILPMTSVSHRGLLETAIGQLTADGGTNSEAGLRLGYETALTGLDANATNRVIFLSDGVANVGITDPNQISEGLKPIREKGVYLNTIGVGMNNHNDTLLEQLADKGDGMCSYIDDMREAKRVMMDNFMGSVETIARDVKIQVEFDPAQVARYRLLGYENRAVADADFRNDKIDAGEVGAGHQVTALYEIERSMAVGAEKPLATVRLRYKAPRLVNGPANEEATEIKQDVLGSQQTSFEGADAGYRRAVIVGQFAEFLRRSVNARGRSIDDLLAEAHKLEAQIPQDTEFHEFVALAERSKQLVLQNLPNCDELCQAIDAYRTWQFQCAQAERLSLERQQQIVEDLARQNRDMEQKIRELLRRRLENTPK